MEVYSIVKRRVIGSFFVKGWLTSSYQGFEIEAVLIVDKPVPIADVIVQIPGYPQ